ncbi:Dam family site-specific DNA-(adenine-N6)-methyltransferase [bacterium]|nr:Dam family site-specific DNA-(adenine-N6)-methyltransferase [bacterium]
MIQPFLKYAGGKRSIMDILETHYPEKIKRYFEPFVGGGAVFFNILNNEKICKSISEFVINDINPHISNAYKNIAEKPNELLDALSKIYSDYESRDPNEKRENIEKVKKIGVPIRKFKEDEIYTKAILEEKLISLEIPSETINEIKKPIKESSEKNKRLISSILSDRGVFYYKLRKKFNEAEDKRSCLSTARLIFLNRHGFNGMYRENSNGDLNIPYGRPEYYDLKEELKKNKKIVKKSGFVLVKDRIEKISKKLKAIELKIMHGDYLNVFKLGVHENDFFYLDPPYYKLSKSASFSHYTKNKFGLKEQEKLFKDIRVLGDKCKILFSNSSSNKIKEFFEEYLKDREFIEIDGVEASRNINSEKKLRKNKQSEFLTKNYAK